MPDLPNGLHYDSNVKARYIMIGGFLGAGKTTAILRLAEHLSNRGLRVGLITNDQGSNLADTATLRAQGFNTEEITGGCFCCRFNSLVEAARQLATRTRPDVFIAEPVGSCTDLLATVIYPLRKLYDTAYTIAPLSVLVDPVRARRIFGLEQGRSFSRKVIYIYEKQLEEADLVVISKCDLVDEASLQSLRETLTARWPDKEVLSVSSRKGTNLESWFERLANAEFSPRGLMNVDYNVYAEGEALLGWLDCTVAVSAAGPFDGNEFLFRFASAIQQHLQKDNAEVAHLKMSLTPEASLGDLAVINLVRNDFVPELGFKLEEPLQGGQCIVNLRAEAAPELLSSAVCESLAATARDFDVRFTVEYLEQFRPAKPAPTHRAFPDNSPAQINREGMTDDSPG